MTPELCIRPALSREVVTLTQIAICAWERDLQPYLRDASPALERRRLYAAIRDGLDLVIVAETSGAPVGWCQRLRERAYIPFLFVLPPLQNRGIGSALLMRTESLLALEGADRVELDTLADNVRAVAFYQHQGYQILALRTEGRAGHEAPTSIRLEKRLDPWRGPTDDLA